MSTPRVAFVAARFAEAEPAERTQMLSSAVDQSTSDELRALLEQLMEKLHLPSWVRSIVRIFAKGALSS